MSRPDEPSDSASLPDATTERRVVAAIARAKRISADGISRGTSFEELGVDSLDAIEILFELEEEFDLQIPDDAVKGMERVSQVVEAVEEALGVAGAEGAG